MALIQDVIIQSLRIYSGGEGSSPRLIFREIQIGTLERMTFSVFCLSSQSSNHLGCNL